MRFIDPLLSTLTFTGLLLVAGGCASGVSHQATNGVQLELNAPKHFSSYRELFTFIARNELVARGDADEVDAKSVLKMAAESDFEICHPADQFPQLYLITPRYYHFARGGLEAYDTIRGAQGNGTFYLVAVRREHLTETYSPDPGFTLVGIAVGNAYTWENIADGPLRFITSWHIGARTSPKSVYEWDGKVFRLARSETDADQTDGDER